MVNPEPGPFVFFFLTKDNKKGVESQNKKKINAET